MRRGKPIGKRRDLFQELETSHCQLKQDLSATTKKYRYPCHACGTVGTYG